MAIDGGVIFYNRSILSSCVCNRVIVPSRSSKNISQAFGRLRLTWRLNKTESINPFEILTIIQPINKFDNNNR